MISAIVPAAGMSTRMGEHNKLLMTYRGKFLIEHAVDTLLASRVSEIIVVAGFEADKLNAALRGKLVTIIDNPDYREGLSTSIKTGISAISREATAIVIYLADQPMLEPGDVNQIIDAYAKAREAGKSIVVPFHKGQRGNPVIMDASFKEEIMDVAGDVGCRKVIKRNPDKVLVLEMETDHVIRDIDRMEDYEALG
jgi:molybdenum cofactor cytidylyltransferase